MLFYRMGDFYELFFEDAEIASRALGIVLTKRGKHQGADIPMCGVPVERADDYLQRLIALGHRVAVCEQTEDPAEAKKRGSKSVVRRDVVRLVTPGTITEDRLLDPARANLFLAVARRRLSETEWRYGLAAVDISTGRFTLAETDVAGLSAEIARLDPREIVVPDAVHDDPALRSLWTDTRAAVTPLPREGLDPASAERRLKAYFGVATWTRSDPSTAPRSRPPAAPSIRGENAARQPPGAPAADAGGKRCGARHRCRDARQSRTHPDLGGERAGSLLATIDCTVTPGGARLLAERLAGPLTEVAAIRRRQDARRCPRGSRRSARAPRATLRQTPDLARALSRSASAAAARAISPACAKGSSPPATVRSP
jgi:DNA mismatch repair protein MutS